MEVADGFVSAELADLAAAVLSVEQEWGRVVEVGSVELDSLELLLGMQVEFHLVELELPRAGLEE